MNKYKVNPELILMSTVSVKTPWLIGLFKQFVTRNNIKICRGKNVNQAYIHLFLTVDVARLRVYERWKRN